MRIVISFLSLLSLSSVASFSPSKLNQRHFSGISVNAVNERATIFILAAKIGVFFGTSTGNTERVADLISDEFGDDAEGPFEIDEIQGSVAKTFAAYDALVVGTPTWNTGADTERSGTGWDEIYYGEMQGKVHDYLHVNYTWIQWYLSILLFRRILCSYNSLK